MTKARNIADLGSNDVIETTATGVDVTGTVTADGLTVDGESTVDSVAYTANSTFPTTGVTLNANGFSYEMTGSQGKIFRSENNTKALMQIGINGDVSFYEDTGTTAKMVWDASAESLGIGTSSPSAKLDVNGDISVGSGSTVSWGGAYGVGIPSITGLLGGLRFYPNGSTSGETMRIDSAGNVGIGTASPSAKLEIASGTIKTTPVYSTGNFFNAFHSAPSAGGDGGLYMGAISPNNSDISSGGYYYSGGNYIAKDTTASKINLSNNGIIFSYNSGLTSGSTYAPSERARINSSGHLLVGTTSATDFLSSSGTGIAFYNNGAITNATNNGPAIYANRQGTDGEVINIRKDGSTVGSIGIRAGTAIYIESGGTGTAGLDFDGAIAPRYAGGLSDNTVDLGVSGYRFKDLYLSGTIRSVSIYNNTSSGNANLGISAGGEVYRSTSSIKYKEDVQDAQHGLTELLSLRPVTYRGINDGDTVFGGLIAEEVHDAGLTEFVEYDEDGEPDALAYANMVSLCIKAIQEQQEAIETLKARIENLENK